MSKSWAWCYNIKVTKHRLVAKKQRDLLRDNVAEQWNVVFQVSRQIDDAGHRSEICHFVRRLTANLHRCLSYQQHYFTSTVGQYPMTNAVYNKPTAE